MILAAAVWLAQDHGAPGPSGWTTAAVVHQPDRAVACDVAAILSGIWAQRTGEVAQWQCEVSQRPQRPLE